MIQNIVFDMGNVLMRYDPHYMVEQLAQPQNRALLEKEIFGSAEWAQLDAGAISQEAFIETICARLPESACSDARHVFAHWHEYMIPMDDTYHLVKELKAKGYKLYLLSNAGVRFHQYESSVPAFQLLDGRFISADFKCVKPNPVIYQTFCSHFGLRPEECLFIDDMPVNVEGGVAAKMDGICYQGDVNQLREELRAHGVLVETKVQFVPVRTKEQLWELDGLANEVWHQHFASILSPEQIEYMVQKFQCYDAMKQQLADGYQYFFFHEPEGNHGYVGIHLEDEALFLSKLYLLEPYRGRHLASKALEYLISIAENHGCRRIYLTVNRFNTHTIEVYKHWGFRIVREQCADIGGGFVMDDYVMELTV